MILDSTLRTLQVVLVSPPATNQLPVVVDWVDNTTTTFSPGSTVTNTTGTTPVTVLAAPAASTQRKVNGLSIYNSDTAAVNVQVYYNDNGTLYQIQDVVLQIDDVLSFTDVGGWKTTDRNGNTKGIGAAGAQGVTGNSGPQGVSVLSWDGEEGPEGFPVPGPRGIQGIQGQIGIQTLPYDGEEGPEGFPIPGNPGPQGTQGITGNTGPMGPAGIILDGEEGPEGFPIPGQRGVTGNTGPQGPQGPIGIIMDGDEGPEGFPIPGPVGPSGALIYYSNGIVNLLRNGRFTIAQRGTNGSFGTTATYTADRWAAWQAGTSQGIWAQAPGAGGGAQATLTIGRSSGATATGTIYLVQALTSADSIPWAGGTLAFTSYFVLGANFSGSGGSVTCTIYGGTGIDQSAASVLSWPGLTTLATMTSGAGFLNNFISVPSNINQIAVVYSYTPVGTAGAQDNFSLWYAQLQNSVNGSTSVEILPYHLDLFFCQRYYQTFGCQVPVTATPASIPINMRAIPTITGGGTGYSSTNTSAATLTHSQTTTAFQTLVLNSEL